MPSFLLDASFPVLTLLALTIESLVGYPPSVFAAIGHPVTWIGALVGALDRGLNRDTAGFWTRRAAGILALVVVLAVTFAVAEAIVWLFCDLVAETAGSVAGLVVLAIVAATLPAQRSLEAHVRRVAEGLDQGLEAGRQAVSMIVGRNPAHLDEAGVARAAIESLAENFSDGIVAPTVWMMVAGLPGALLYKAINTCDSMIGHRTPRHRAFGWAAARLDDVVNLPASRLAGLWLGLAALLTPGASARGALRAVWRDAGRHTSPNAGWPEAAMAGALGFALAGPRVYGETRIEAAFMGDGRSDLSAADIRDALALYRTALLIQGTVVVAIVALVI